jgi:hypothetical protein
MRAKEFWSGIVLGLVLGWVGSVFLFHYAFRGHSENDRRLLIAVSKGSEELQRCSGKLYAAEKRKR